LDRELGGGFFAGVAAGYSHSELWEEGESSGTLDSPRGALYGGWEQGRLTLGGLVGYAHHFVESARPGTATGETARADYGIHEVSAAAQASYRFEAEGLALVPRLGLQYARLMAEEFEEEGAAGFDLTGEDRDLDSLRPFVGLGVSRSFETAGGTMIVPRLDLGYARELLDTAPAGAIAVGGGSFTAEALEPS